MLKLLIFDFDGTLADSVELCIETFRRILERYMKEKAPSRAELLSHFGLNEYGILQMFLGAKADEAFADFCRLHGELHEERCPAPLPGIREMLNELSARGVTLAVVTGRSENTCKISMEKLHLGQYFKAFRYGSSIRNDKGRQITELMQEFGVTPAETAYVGDAVSDYEAAAKAQVMTFSAAWASTAWTDDLNKVNPGLVFTSVDALRVYLREHTAGAGK